MHVTHCHTMDCMCAIKFSLPQIERRAGRRRRSTCRGRASEGEPNITSIYDFAWWWPLHTHTLRQKIRVHWSLAAHTHAHIHTNANAASALLILSFRRPFTKPNRMRTNSSGQNDEGKFEFVKMQVSSFTLMLGARCIFEWDTKFSW